jgi:hypothetical protein
VKRWRGKLYKSKGWGPLVIYKRRGREMMGKGMGEVRVGVCLRLEWEHWKEKSRVGEEGGGGENRNGQSIIL